MSMEGDPLKKALEGLIFLSQEPVGVKALAHATETPEETVAATLSTLAAEMEASPTRGVRLVEVAGGWQMRTPPALAPIVRRFREAKPVRLSRAALETLSVVAYRQPVTRPEIEQLRGVDSGAVLGTLLERRLVLVSGRREGVGRPVEYSTTPEFLEVFGLADLKELPPLRELEELITRGEVTYEDLTGRPPAEPAPGEGTPGPGEGAPPPSPTGGTEEKPGG